MLKQKKAVQRNVFVRNRKVEMTMSLPIMKNATIHKKIGMAVVMMNVE
jgi:hypothetical protein